MAFEWYMKSAIQGYMLSQYNIGCLYMQGKGVEKDIDAAFKWFLKAALNGDSKSKNNIGCLYYDGHGIEQNHTPQN